MRAFVPSLVVVSTALAQSAGAQLPPPASAEIAGLSQGADWPAGNIAAQLDRDPTLVPFGKGALFVPAMTNPLDEPPVTVWRDGRKVADSTTGKRVVLAPGEYQVSIGSGAFEQQFTQTVRVVERSTSVVPVTWSSLSVHLVDERYNSVRAAYEMIRMDDLEYIGVGFGVDELAGEPLPTWVLRPGLYKLVQVGDSYRARTNFTTVRLLAGAHTEFLLVVEAETGTFQGAGEVTKLDVFRPTEAQLGSLVVGGDVTMNSRRNVVGSPDGETYSLSAFLDGKLNLKIFDNPLLLQLQLEEGQAKQPDTDWRKARDRADIDALYVYSWLPWIGPYLRVGGETNLFPSYQYFDSPRSFIEYNASGNELRRQLAQERVRLQPAFGLSTIKEGVGVNLRVLKTLFAESTVRTGLGARHLLANRVQNEVQDDNTPELDFRRVSSSHQFGVEATLLAVGRATRYIVATIELDALFPLYDIRSLEAENTSVVVVDGNATVAFKLTEFASLNYVLRFLRDRNVSPLDQLEHDIQLRFSLALP